MNNEMKILNTLTRMEVHQENLMTDSQDAKTAMVDMRLEFKSEIDKVRMSIDGNGKPGIKQRLGRVESNLMIVSWLGSAVSVVGLSSLSYWIRQKIAGGG